MNYLQIYQSDGRTIIFAEMQRLCACVGVSHCASVGCNCGFFGESYLVLATSRAGDFIDALIIICIMDLCVLSPKKLPCLRACMRLYNKKLPTWASVVLLLHSPIFSARIIVLNSLFHTCFLQITVKVTNEFTMNKDNQHSISKSFVAEGLGIIL